MPGSRARRYHLAELHAMVLMRPQTTPSTGHGPGELAPRMYAKPYGLSLSNELVNQHPRSSILSFPDTESPIAIMIIVA